MGRIENLINIEEYVQSRVPDKAELARLLVEAKGPNRNMAEFAKDCGSSAPTFSRILRCKITKPIDKKLLISIAEHSYACDSDAAMEMMIHSLLHANGMVTKGFLEDNTIIDWSLEEKKAKEQFFSEENEVRNIITMSLLNRGLTVRYLAFIPPDTGINTYLREYDRNVLDLYVEENEPKYHRYQVECVDPERMTVRAEYIDDPELKRDYMGDARTLFRETAFLYLVDAWEPQTTEKLKNSIVFNNKQYYEEYWKYVKDKQVYSWISLILVDMDTKEVVEERFIQRHDGKSAHSLFSLPQMVYEPKKGEA